MSIKNITISLFFLGCLLLVFLAPMVFSNDSHIFESAITSAWGGGDGADSGGSEGGGGGGNGGGNDGGGGNDNGGSTGGDSSGGGWGGGDTVDSGGSEGDCCGDSSGGGWGGGDTVDSGGSEGDCCGSEPTEPDEPNEPNDPPGGGCDGDCTPPGCTENCTPPPTPSCDFLNASANTVPPSGGDVTLEWGTTNADTVTLNNGVGVVAPDDTLVVNVTSDITYTLTVSNAQGSTNCSVPITLETTELPSCDFFTGTPQNFVDPSGGSATLEWGTTNADTVTINNGVGVVSPNDSRIVDITGDITYTLTVSNAYGSDTCSVPFTVGSEPSASCDSFTASPSSFSNGSGGTVELTWETTNVTNVSINNGIGPVDPDGSTTVNVTDHTTFTLTGTGPNFEPCKVSVSVDGGGGGGGGGGSSRPRCEFLASDKDITSGEEITLSWETTRGREVVIYEGDEDDDNKIYETDDDDEVDEGAIRVRPTEDTKYTLVVSRGSSDRNCVVRIDVDDDEVVLGSARVAGIALTEVPYTGFEAGPFLTFVFYALLTLWGLFVAYTLVIREERVFGFALPGALSRGRILTDDVSTDNGATSDMPEAAQYVSSVVTPARNTTHVAGAPANLPTGNYEPVIGYAALTETNDTETETSDEMTELEDQAHEQKVLLSSDAMRHLVSVCPGDINRLVYLDQVIAEAKISYPTEDGWLVLNLDRMCELTKKRKGNALTVEQTAVVAEKLVEVPVGAGSLAEAIVTGNINAAYQMIGHRPMIALADAAADLDNVFRARKGEQVFISNLLAKETTGITTEKIEAAIAALTGALDGTYTDEASAVKMAILKATKALV